MWLARHGGTDYWKVAAVFGSVLLAMGMVGRKRSDNAAASNLTQGLGALSLALVLKLDGYHLGLALAGESLALAIAFHRFRKRAEFAFSLLAGTGAALMALYLHNKAPEAPAWSGLLAAVLVGMAAAILRFNVERSENPAPDLVRSGTSVLCYSSLAILLLGWCYHLTEAWQLPVAMGLAALFAVVAVKFDRDGWLPEIGRASGIAGFFATLLLFFMRTPWQGHAFAIPFAVVACAAWHQSTHKREILTSTFAWLFAVLVPVVSIRMLGQWYPNLSQQVLPLAVSSVSLVVIARLVGAHRLEITSTVLNVIALAMVGFDLLRADSVISQSISFVPAATAFATLWVIRFKREHGKTLQGIIAASCLFVAWPVALLNAVPQHAIDLMAISAGIGFLVATKRNDAAPVYCWGWTLVSLTAYFAVLAGGPSSPLHSHRFEGFALVLLLIGIAMKRPRSSADLPASALDLPLSWLACIVLSVWTTHITVDHFGWKSVSVLWTVLGFGMVSFGLMMSRVTSRQAGFLLLTLALLKLFFVDVWDFTTFMRVVSFIALGLALVVLGLFYHRFAPALKRMIKQEEVAEDEDG
jgi:peptidoglycan/LPS O-acetylase OafA/YrhL